MNNVTYEELKQNNLDILEKYGLTQEVITEFREKIKKVSTEESERLGKELYAKLKEKNYNDEADFIDIESLIYEGANIEYKEEKKGDYSLLVCSRKNYLKTFIVLLKAGANVNQINNYLTTPTMASARHGNKEILELLILMKADVNARCLDGDNAVMSAKRHNQIECFNLLVNANAYLNNRNLSNQNIVDIKSNEIFNFAPLAYSLQNYIPYDVTDVAANNLIQEAIEEMKKVSEKTKIKK